MSSLIVSLLDERKRLQLSDEILFYYGFPHFGTLHSRTAFRAHYVWCKKILETAIYGFLIKPQTSTSQLKRKENSLCDCFHCFQNQEVAYQICSNRRNPLVSRDSAPRKCSKGLEDKYIQLRNIFHSLTHAIFTNFK